MSNTENKASSTGTIMTAHAAPSTADDSSDVAPCTTESLITRGQAVLQETYKQYPMVLDHGKGVYLYDTEGNKYLDFGAGIAVNALGYNHPKQIAAITEQATKLLHCSNLYWNKPAIELAELLVAQAASGGDTTTTTGAGTEPSIEALQTTSPPNDTSQAEAPSKVYFANSGTEANEAAIKLARKYGSLGATTDAVETATDFTSVADATGSQFTAPSAGNPSQRTEIKKNARSTTTDADGASAGERMAEVDERASETLTVETSTLNSPCSVGNPSRTEIISMKESFHGRSYGSLTLTGQPKYHKGFYPLVEGVSYAEFNNLESVEALITPRTCAIIVEPVQGESGIHPATPAFLQGLRNLADQHDLVLIFDEVQCGIGRMGTFYAYQSFGVTPDIVTLAKGLGGGLPIGAMICSERVNCFVPGNHAGTYCGNPLVTAGALAVTSEISSPAFLAQVTKNGEFLQKSLQALSGTYPQVVEVRGKGLMLGVELTVPAAPVVAEARKKGLLLIPAGEKVVRFVPPLMIRQDELTKGIAIFAKVLEAVGV